jgi:hypothetical protein
MHNLNDYEFQLTKKNHAKMTYIAAREAIIDREPRGFLSSLSFNTLLLARVRFLLRKISNLTVIRMGELFRIGFNKMISIKK